MKPPSATSALTKDKSIPHIPGLPPGLIPPGPPPGPPPALTPEYESESYQVFDILIVDCFLAGHFFYLLCCQFLKIKFEETEILNSL